MNKSKSSAATLAVLLAESAVLQAELDAHARAGQRLVERSKKLAERFAGLRGGLAADPRVKSILAWFVDAAQGKN